MKRLCTALMLILPGFLTAQARAGELKIVSWVIANLAEAPGIPLRGHVRNEADYEAIRAIIKELAPDVIALQEMQ